ncbi:MAG: type II secretion system protein GspG [Acidobacteriota bacterium]|nr:MAG: type II secretion system protein GspG [Acidobacteriota bacterium]
MADMRSIATASEAYNVDHNTYPTSDARDARVVLVEELESNLEPLYIRTFPTRDSWGNPFSYWSDDQSHVIVSLGDDGTERVDYAAGDDPLSAVAQGETDTPGAEIVFSDGSFVRWSEIL